jgi:Icc-related predicted phosphoesterase
MRCCYMSDLHLETQDYRWPLPAGDVLIIAGDLCHARCLAAGPDDRAALKQRDRVLRLADEMRARFAHVLLVPGNHDHYEGTFSETAGLLRAGLPGVTVLDDATVQIEGVRFFGGTLWTDFAEGTGLDAVRRRCGEFFFVKVREADGSTRKFRPEDALAAFDATRAALSRSLAAANGKRTVVISHHAPSRQGLNPHHVGDDLDGAYASDLDGWITGLADLPVWVHGHTHMRRLYRIGATQVRTDARGFDGRDLSSRGFTGQSSFEISRRAKPAGAACRPRQTQSRQTPCGNLR